MGCTESQERALIQSLNKQKEENKQIEMELRSQINMYEYEINILKDKIKNKEKKENETLNVMSSELVLLIEELDQQKSWKSYRVLKNLLRNYEFVYRYTVNWGFTKWKRGKVEEDQNGYEEYIEGFTTQKENTELASVILKEHNKDLLKKSVVMDLYLQNKEITEKPMLVTKLIRLFEDMMDLKYSQDLRDIEEKRKPKATPEFMLNFLNRSFGLKHLAIKTLNQIIPVLINSAENSKYLKLCCRFLHIHHPEPIGFTIGLYLMRIRIEFNNLINSKGSIIAKFSKITQNTHRLEGGFAFLSDVSTLVFFLFDRISTFRSLTLSLLKPETISKEKYLLFRMCFNLARVSMTAEELFALFDIEKQGFLKKETLAGGVLQHLDILLDNPDLIFGAFDCQDSGKVTREKFLSRLNPVVYAKNCVNEKYMVSKSGFLTVILELYNNTRVNATAQMLNYLSDIIIEEISLIRFTEIVLKLDREMNSEFIEFMYNEIIAMHPNRNFTIENTVKVLVEFAVGNKILKAFCK